MVQQHRSKDRNVARSLLGNDEDDGKGWKKKRWCSGCKQTWSVFKATQNLNLSYWCWDNILIYNCNHQLSHLNQSGLIEGSPALSTFIRQAFDFQYGFGLAKSSRAASAWVIQHSSDWKWRSCRSRTNNSCLLSDLPNPSRLLLFAHRTQNMGHCLEQGTARRIQWLPSAHQSLTFCRKWEKPHALEMQWR